MQLGWQAKVHLELKKGEHALGRVPQEEVHVRGGEGLARGSYATPQANRSAPGIELRAHTGWQVQDERARARGGVVLVRGQL